MGDVKNKNLKVRTSSRGSVRSQDDKDVDDAWECKMCNKTFTDHNAKLLECQRCEKHFCIKCLNKKQAEYEILSNSDTMWFCLPCREKVQQHLEVDKKIEEACAKIRQEYEGRFNDIESKLKDKCDKQEVIELVRSEIAQINIPNPQENDHETIKEIVQEEVKTLQASKTNAANENDKEGPLPDQHQIDDVIGEINERKAREKNMIIFGIEESESQTKTEKTQHDLNKIQELYTDAKINLEMDNIVKIDRIGKPQTSGNKCRPIRVVFKTIDPKLALFKNMHYIRSSPKYEKVGAANDLTRTERENEKRLWNEAQKLQKSAKGNDFLYKVRGPPWARKVVEIRK